MRKLSQILGFRSDIEAMKIYSLKVVLYSKYSFHMATLSTAFVHVNHILQKYSLKKASQE